jgi:hypothetical protein
MSGSRRRSFASLTMTHQAELSGTSMSSMKASPKLGGPFPAAVDVQFKLRSFASLRMTKLPRTKEPT